MNQSTIEYTLHPYHITKDIQEYLLDKYSNDVDSLTTSLRDYISQSYWDSKNTRLEHLANSKDLNKVILSVLTQTVLIASSWVPLLSIASSVSFGLNKYHDIQTCADVLWLINQTDLILIDVVDDTRYIMSNMELPEELVNRINLSCVLPPMVIKPKRLRHNNSSGYLTIDRDSLILGKENYHDKDISLDVLNTLNSQAYQLDLDISYKYEKELTGDEVTHVKAREQFEYFRDVIKDSTIYFTHKVDKRGRIYSMGYVFNTQGSSYEKACINLKTKEYVTGEL